MSYKMPDFQHQRPISGLFSARKIKETDYRTFQDPTNDHAWHEKRS